MVGTNDLDSSAKFYDTLLNIIGLKAIYSDDKCIGYAERDESDIEFYVTKPANGDPATFGNGTQVSFLTDSREKVEKFHKKLRDLYDAKFEYIDERLTTFEARQILKENKTDEVDANAAKILIDNWFEINKK